ncbi:hypothetical protein LINGRAHAP2_LOCUS8160 [Linum grandiflorum]
MNIHYDGNFTYIVEQGLCYMGGGVKYCNWLDPDEMSLVVIDSYLSDVGYLDKLEVTSLDAYRRKNGYSYYWKMDGKKKEEGLTKLISDNEVVDMGVKVVNGKKYVDVYLINDVQYTKSVVQFEEPVHIIEKEASCEKASSYG